MSKNIITLGLSAILGSSTELASAEGAFVENGYTNFGKTYEGTAKLTQEDGEETEFYSEENDDPEEVITKEGKTTLEFAIMDPSLEVIARLFGSEVATDVWAYPDAVADKEESIIVKPRKGLSFHIARGRIKAKFNAAFSKKEIVLIEVKVTALKPTNSGVAKMYIKKLA